METVRVQFTGEPIVIPVTDAPRMFTAISHPLVITRDGAPNRDVFLTRESESPNAEPTIEALLPGHGVTIPAGKAFGVAASDMFAELAGYPSVLDAAPFNVTIEPLRN